MQQPQTAREIIESLPERFRPEKANDYSGVFHLDISGDRGGQFTVIVKNSKIDLQDGLHGEANCTVRAKDKVYEDVELGKSNPQMAIMMGKLKISNLGEMMKFIQFFKRLF